MGCSDTEPIQPTPPPEPPLSVVEPNSLSVDGLTSGTDQFLAFTVQNSSQRVLRKIRFEILGTVQEQPFYTGILPNQSGPAAAKISGKVNGSAEVVGIVLGRDHLNDKEYYERSDSDWVANPGWTGPDSKEDIALKNPDYSPHHLSDDFETRNAVWTPNAWDKSTGTITFEIRYLGKRYDGYTPEVMFRVGRVEYLCTPDIQLGSRFSEAKQKNVPILALAKPEIKEAWGCDSQEESKYQNGLSEFQKAHEIWFDRHEKWEKRHSK